MYKIGYNSEGDLELDRFGPSADQSEDAATTFHAVPDWLVDESPDGAIRINREEFSDGSVRYALYALAQPLISDIRFLVSFPNSRDLEHFKRLAKPLVEPRVRDDKARISRQFNISEHLVVLPHSLLQDWSDGFLYPKEEVWEWCRDNLAGWFEFAAGHVKGGPEHLGIEVWCAVMHFGIANDALMFKMYWAGT